jgi:hypothetical protein
MLKKFRWSGGITILDFSHNNKISNPLQLRVVRNIYPPGFNKEYTFSRKEIGS